MQGSIGTPSSSTALEISKMARIVATVSHNNDFAIWFPGQVLLNVRVCV